jgi:uncharacterized protein YqeY
MSEITLKTRVQNDMKDAMRAKDQKRLDAIRLLLAAIKQREVDERITLDDSQVMAVIEKMLKQRRDSIDQYQKANRQDLVDQESYEVDLLQQYLPAQLTEAEIEQAVAEAVSSTGAASIKDMGKVMGILKPKLQGRADMGVVSAKIKVRLSS